MIGGGNAAADVVAALSRAKRDAKDTTPIYWSNRMEHFSMTPIPKVVSIDTGFLSSTI